LTGEPQFTYTAVMQREQINNSKGYVSIKDIIDAKLKNDYKHLVEDKMNVVSPYRITSKKILIKRLQNVLTSFLF
jgi:hypothetical protein